MKPPAVAIRRTTSDGAVPCPIPGDELGAADGDEGGLGGADELGAGEGDELSAGGGDELGAADGDEVGDGTAEDVVAGDGDWDAAFVAEGFGEAVGVAAEQATAAMATVTRAIVRAAVDT